jgi:hypothetical protein
MDQRQFPRASSKLDGEAKEKNPDRVLLSVPAKKLRMSRKKVEH